MCSLGGRDPNPQAAGGERHVASGPTEHLARVRGSEGAHGAAGRGGRQPGPMVPDSRSVAWAGARPEPLALRRRRRVAERARAPHPGEGRRGVALVQPFISFK